MQRSPLLFVGLMIVVLVGTFLWFRPGEPAPETASAPETTPAPASDERHVAVSLSIAQGKRVEGPAVIRLDQGDKLHMSIHSDSDGELHIHGYDRHIRLAGGEAVTVTLDAALAGRFEYELHGHHDHHSLGVIEVSPR